MSRILLITFIWLTLAALVTGVAHLARPCCCGLSGSETSRPQVPQHLPLVSVQPGTTAGVRNHTSTGTPPNQESATAKPASPRAVADSEPLDAGAGCFAPSDEFAGQKKSAPSWQVPASGKSASAGAVGTSNAPASVNPSTASASPAAATATSAIPTNAPSAASSKQESHAPPPQKQKPPAKDPDDDGSNGGLGRLPKGVDPEYEGLGVTCLNQSTGRPVGDVAVRAMTSKELEAWSSAHGGASVDEADPKVVLDSVTTPAKSSQYGIAITDSGPGRMLVDARMGNLYGYKWVDRNKTSQVKITLVEDQDLVFRTRSADGSAVAGMPVVVIDAQCVEIWRGVTRGDDASVHMRHAGYLIDRDATGDFLAAYVEGVFPSVSPIGLVRGKLPAGDLDLVVPASHPLRVHVKDPRGNPVTQPFEVTLSSTNDQGAPCSSRTTRTTQNGVAVFERVEPVNGPKLPLQVNGRDVFDSTSQQVDTNQGDIEVSFARAFPVARIKIEDAAGKPLAQARLRPWLLFQSSVVAAPAGRGEYTTAADGSVGIPLARNSRVQSGNPEETPALSAIVLVQLDPSGDSIASVEVPLPPDSTAGDRDLGTSRMKELPFVVQGYVVDDRDAAVPGARVGVRRSDKLQNGYVMYPGLDWGAVSDMSGFFKLRAMLADGDLDLACDAPDHVMMPLAHVERGDKKVRIVMARFGTLISKFVLPPGMPTDLLSMNIESGPQHTTARLDKNAIVHVTHLAPGKIKVSVSIAGIAKPVVSLDDVEVKPGVEVTDAHVTQIDLRQLVYYRTLHVNDPDGKPISSVTGRVVEATEDRRPPRRIEGRDGVVTFLTMQASADVNLSAPGFVTQELHGIDKDTDVVLERAPR